MVGLCLLLAGCGGGSLSDTPAAWFHDMEGGQIAAARPPPPGAGLPYPHLGTVPAKPRLPDSAYRHALQDQLTAQRDRALRVAAATPIVIAPPPPPGPAPRPAAEGDAAAPPAAATLATADAPPARPAPATAPLAEPVPDGPASDGPAPGTPVSLAGAGVDTSTLPPIPEAPPAPASFEGVPAQPPPTPPPPVPTGAPATPGATQILFATGEATLRPSQTETLKILAGRRGKQTIEITGAGEAISDSPDGQAAAIDLALRRAHAVAAGLMAQNVPSTSIRLAAYAFGRGATARLLP